MRLVRFADDFLLTFERREDAKRLLAALPDRLAKFGLSLQEGKTRLVKFGRYAASDRERRGEGRPEAFDFLGFTHYCGTNPERTLHGHAEDPAQADDPQARGTAPGDEAPTARSVMNPRKYRTPSCGLAA
ncbi:MAG: hypothetical protein E5X86_33290 [Mesorhizobium sp.]|uniref:reverse transcriptase domain-containing protein n=1 Tax=Mesorhizobium sp. TaxID=1871066 RepID=UPI0011FDB2EF|nr:reverse transcriptase domain-containing protein [Mesorhizobium sp.]TIO12428.1 MAG: hypothetical protein E5X86_33290 [Mesorhizobium sp.]